MYRPHLHLIMVFFGLSLLLASCKATEKAEDSWQRKLEPYMMLFGDVEQTVFIDRYVVAGQMEIDFQKNHSLAATLEKLGLTGIPARSQPISIHYPRGRSYQFVLLRKQDGTVFDRADLSGLRELLEKHAIHVGPAIYYKSGEVWGILPHHIRVYLKRGTPQKRIDEIFQEAQRSVAVHPDFYHVEYDAAIGYDIIEKAKQLLNLDEVSLVEHPLMVINRHSTW